MCLAVIALDAHPRYPLVIAANRDEYHARPAARAAWGDAAPFAGVLAGRDLSAGGTWFGVRQDGRWALVTNVREGGRARPDARSRGELVLQMVNAANPVEALASLDGDRDAYNGFNLLAGTLTDAGFASNRAAGSAPLTAGLHGLSNAALDTPWPKVTRTLDALARWVDEGADGVAPLFDMLALRGVAADAQLPATGVSLEWERALSAAFIVGETYGTRCSTVFTVDRDGGARFHERSFNAAGAACGEIVERFELR